MASNFGIAIDKISDGFGLKLAGDFDATSAYELICAIKKLPKDTVKISIHTNDLKSIFPLGLDVFHRNMSPLMVNPEKLCSQTTTPPVSPCEIPACHLGRYSWMAAATGELVSLWESLHRKEK